MELEIFAKPKRFENLEEGFREDMWPFNGEHSLHVCAFPETWDLQNQRKPYLLWFHLDFYVFKDLGGGGRKTGFGGKCAQNTFYWLSYLYTFCLFGVCTRCDGVFVYFILWVISLCLDWRA